MAGEHSKSIGEVGESIAEHFFKIIGWGLPQKGVFYACYNSKEHALKEAKGDKKNQHGIDFQVNYKSALEAETINNLLISVKHSKSTPYPKSATERFKGFVRDLVHSMECFKRSPQRQKIASSKGGCKAINDIPVLFYISSKDQDNHDYVSYLRTSRFINEFDVKELYVIDNKKVTFILDIINYIEKVHSDYEWYFYHPYTGMNIADTSIQHHSKIMQIEFLTSTFIPFILKKNVGDHETCKFFLASVDSFSDDNLSRFITYCRDNSNDTIRDIEISMEGYFPDDHDNAVRAVLNNYNDEKNLNIKVSNYHPNFRALAND